MSDVRLNREGLGRMLTGYPGIEVVGTASPFDPTLGLMAELKPQIVLIDSSTVRRTDVCRLVPAISADARMVAFAVPEEDEHAILACARAGVCGLVPSDASVEDLVNVILTTNKEHACCSPRIAAALIRGVATLGTTPPRLDEPVSLTQRERQVLQRIDRGLSNKEIASQLGISVITVKNHIHNILGKLSLHRRGEAAAFLRSQHSSPASPLAREI